MPARRKTPVADARLTARTNGRSSASTARRPAHQPAPHEALDLSPDQLRRMFRLMLVARAIDERQWVLNRQGRQAFHISCQGHEASGVGGAMALAVELDLLIGYYRSLPSALVFGITPLQAFLAGLARATDLSSGGRQMPNHFALKPHILTTGSSVATQIPHASGAALASKLRGDGAVCLAYFGDGATSKGDFHEGLNFAAVHQLPAIFVCENNGYAISVPVARQMASHSVADRAAGYGMAGVAIDGTDPLAVYAAVRTAADRARAGEGPTLIESNVVRLTPHSSDDDDRRYRDDEDRQRARERDPLIVFERYLLAHDLLDDVAAAELKRGVKQEVDVALAEAEAAPEPAAETAFDHIYADRRIVNPFSR